VNKGISDFSIRVYDKYNNKIYERNINDTLVNYIIDTIESIP